MEKIAAQGGDGPLADQEFHWSIINVFRDECMRKLYSIINSAVNEIIQISQNRRHVQDVAVRDNPDSGISHAAG